MPRAIRDMYHYYATMMEPWDGPAALLFSDGDLVGACLDRNGLRPLRYYELSDGRVVLASEVGVLDLSPSQVVCKARLSRPNAGSGYPHRHPCGRPEPQRGLRCPAPLWGVAGPGAAYPGQAAGAQPPGGPP